MINLEKIQNIKIFLGNKQTIGKILEINKEKVFFIEIPKGYNYVPVELNKRGFISFEHERKNCIIGGMFYCQGPYKIIFVPETDIEEEKRNEVRFETRIIPAEIHFKSGYFHKKSIKGEILNICSKGAAIETLIPLEKNITCLISCSFPYKQKTFLFSANCIQKYSINHKNYYVNGVEFIQIDFLSGEVLKKFINNLQSS